MFVKFFKHVFLVLESRYNSLNILFLDGWHLGILCRFLKLKFALNSSIVKQCLFLYFAIETMGLNYIYDLEIDLLVFFNKDTVYELHWSSLGEHHRVYLNTLKLL